MNPVTPFGLKWELKRSFWVVFVLFPFTAPLSYFYIGFRAKNIRWFGLAFLYLILIDGLSLVLYHITLDHDMAGLVVPAILLGWLNALFTGFRERVFYLKHLYETMEPAKRTALATAERERREERLRRQQEKRAPSMLSRSEIHEKQSGRVKFIARRQRERPDLAIININNASQEEISRLPGVGAILAQKIITTRNQENTFNSLEHFIKVTQIEREILKEATPYIAFSDEEVEDMKARLNVRKKGKRVGRKVDY